MPLFTLFSASSSGAVRPLVFSLGLLLALAACGKKEAAGPPQRPPLEITVAEPLEREGVDWDEFTGRVAAIEVVDIRARVDGYLTEIRFRDGDEVKKGDLLYVIDPRPYMAEVKRNEADLGRARAQLDLARQEHERAESLQKSRAIAAADFDAKVTALAQAQATVESGEAALDTARLNLEFCYIKAPVAGRLSRTTVTVGNLVESGKEVLTTLVSQDPMYVYFDADENALLRYQQMSSGGAGNWDAAEKSKPVPVELALANETGYPHKGRLDFVDNRVDSNTGTIRLRGVFENPKGHLTPGLFARVRVPGSAPYTARLVPDPAIGTDQGNHFVLVVDAENKVQYRRVVLGPMHGGLRVIRSGLEPGEKIATTGLQMLTSGTLIAPKPVTLEIQTETASR